MNMSSSRSIIYITIITFLISSLAYSLPCPPICVCSKDLKLIDCSYRALLRVPIEIPTEAVSLNLRNNPLVLTNSSFSGLRLLQEIDLRYCQLTTLPLGLFNGLVLLRTLRLDGNQLGDCCLEPLFSKFSKQLDEIDLSGNQLTQIPPLAFKTLSKLRLDSNRIVNATFPDSFIACQSLRSINLSKNRIFELSATAFQSISSRVLLTVHLDHNRLDTIDPAAFAPLADRLIKLILDGNSQLSPASLQDAFEAFIGARQLAGLSLRSMGITNITDSLLSNLAGSGLTTLHLSKNPIQIITPDAFASLGQLQFLHLSECRLSNANIPLDSFHNLVELWIDGNNFTEVPTRLPPSLVRLHLQDNCIGLLEQRQFSQLPLLTHLDLSDNRIWQLPAGSFSGLTKLSHLNLRENAIRRIVPGISLDLISLQTLDMSTQEPPLETIEPDSLVFPSLTTLLLKRNKLGTQLQNSSVSPFAKLTKLQLLDLSTNQISGIYNASLAGLLGLRFLSLSKNQIQFWEALSFETFKKTLETLDLSYNQIRSVEKTVTDNNSLSSTVTGVNFHSLNMSGNPFNCSCRNLAWFVAWATATNKVTVTHFKDYTCSSPRLWAGRDLREFNPAVECSGVPPAVKGVTPRPSAAVRHGAGVPSGTIVTVTLLCVGLLSVGAVLRMRNGQWKPRRGLYQPLETVDF